jgi:hypothetical protein
MRRAVVVFTLALSPAIGAQAPSPQSAPERPRFEAASVKPNTSPDGGIRNQFSPGRFTCLNTRLDSLISIAYRINPDRVLGVPDWARTAKYDIAATHSPEYREFSLQQLLMLQRLLEERFALQSTPRNGLPLQAAAGVDRVPIFTAMQEQLGLRLQSARAPLDVLVVNRLERPTGD